MNHLLAKKKGRNTDYVKIMSDVDVFELPNDLDNPRTYDSDYSLDDDEWFAISDFSEKEYSLEILTNDFVSAEYDQIRNQDYRNIKFLCFYQEDEYFFFQKLTPSQTVNKKWFKISEEPELMTDNPIIIIKPVADAVYSVNNDILYFKRLQSITTIFKGIGDLYREATQEDTEEFLENDFINLTEDYDASKVKTANRKRIAMAMDTFNNFNEVDRGHIFNYIKEYCTDLTYSDEESNFEIGSEENLKKLLYGIEQRYYTTPLGGEKRLANSITALQ